MKKNFELLAPAGNIKSFQAACSAGADAIYMGLNKFNARAMAENFNLDEYIKCIKYAHKLKMKVYLTLNTIMTSYEVEEALNLIFELYKNGLDAVILQDIGLATKIHEIFPDLPMHASTQMSVYSLSQVEFLKSIGFTRVVLARELTIDEITYICKNTDVEIEVFVHGALCVSLSGQCLLSYAIGGRSANKGQCAQPCRMKYSLINDSKNKTIASLKYLLSKKDIFGIDLIKRLKDAGVYSFKIEGRNRSSQYVNLIVTKYRKALDDEEVSFEDKKEASQMFVRDTLSTGYLNGVEYKKSITSISPKNTGLYLGEVLDQRGKFIKIKLNESISLHDGFEIYNTNDLNTEYSSIITCIKDEKNKVINDEEIKAGSTVFIGDVNRRITFKSKVYKTSSYKLNTKYSLLKERKPKVDVQINILPGKNIECVTNINKNDIITKLYYVPQTAIKASLTSEKVVSSFRKTGELSIEYGKVDVNIENNLFVPAAIINQLRREHSNSVNSYLDDLSVRKLSLEQIHKIQDKLEQIKTQMDKIGEASPASKPYNSHFIYSFKKGKKYDINSNDKVYINIQDFIKNEDEILKSFKNLYIAIPNYTGRVVSSYISNNLERLIQRGINGILLGSFEHFGLASSLKEKYNIKLVADYSFNISNIYAAKLFKDLKFDIITPSFEIYDKDIELLAKILPLEFVTKYMTVMTSRYCIIGAFDQNRNTKEDVCHKPCIRDKFIIKDEKGYIYHILCDPFDCIMKVVKPIKTEIDKNYNVRNYII